MAPTSSNDHDLQLGWPGLDHIILRSAGTPPGPDPRMVELVAHPPDRPAGVGYLALQIHGRAVADIDLQLCQLDHIGVIEQVSVDLGYRRRGLATVLVAAALARGPGFSWSTTAIDATVAARAFWASLDTAEPLQFGQPRYCNHMTGDGL
ncbi:GNAT family N-acetyltransferase [Amycolatopsis sp. PS_44_ISF1]|uniref:GNAT family N-acetyltransferase n=1 Tax=Amycolatopsis sp. PS_44_ISF1 TaxID=2974917 RepID=UPI0028DDA273|nr:GNAT family N-acetyltransferase [Amycolatopsis sp. PS_44_ISF1]MDT8913465.1 hypothetical protein [Amycolatopsis sp. PS_44_ISF1]